MVLYHHQSNKLHSGSLSMQVDVGQQHKNDKKKNVPVFLAFKFTPVKMSQSCRRSKVENKTARLWQRLWRHEWGEVELTDIEALTGWTQIPVCQTWHRAEEVGNEGVWVIRQKKVEQVHKALSDDFMKDDQSQASSVAQIEGSCECTTGYIHKRQLLSLSSHFGHKCTTIKCICVCLNRKEKYIRIIKLSFSFKCSNEMIDLLTFFSSNSLKSGHLPFLKSFCFQILLRSLSEKNTF